MSGEFRNYQKLKLPPVMSFGVTLQAKKEMRRRSRHVRSSRIAAVSYSRRACTIEKYNGHSSTSSRSLHKLRTPQICTIGEELSNCLNLYTEPGIAGSCTGICWQRSASNVHWWLFGSLRSRWSSLPSESTQQLEHCKKKNTKLVTKQGVESSAVVCL